MLALLLAIVPAGATENFSRYVTMPDGVRLAVDIWLPDQLLETENVPAIVEFTRYWRATETEPPTDNLNDERRQTLDHGYAFVAVDVRGTGASFGVRAAEFSLAEARDMPHVIDWIARQPWSNGKVVSMGISYPGNAAELAGLYRSPALVAAVPRFTDFDWYTSIVVPGGLKNAYITERWGDGVQALDRNDAGIFGDPGPGEPKVIGVKPVDSDPARELLAAAVREHRGNRSLADNLGGLTYRDEYPNAASLQDGDGMAVSIHDLEEEYEAAAMPMYHWGSWFDAGTAAGVLARFNAFDAPYRYVIGPWSHGARFDANPYKPASAPVDPPLDEQFDSIFEFADSFVDGDASPPKKELTYFTVGANAWKSTDRWPPAGHRLERWWLDEGGALSKKPPGGSTGADYYTVDFEAGSGRSSRWSTQLGGGDVYYGDRSEADQRLLTYTSPPLRRSVEITGTATVTLKLRSTHDDGGLIVYLEDVDEDGYVRMLSEGVLRLRHRTSDLPDDPVLGPRRSFERQDGRALVPDQVNEVRLALLPISARIDAGHALRIAIAGHDKDTFIRVPAEGDPVLTIERNSESASFIDLPVIDRAETPAEAEVEAWADAMFSEALARKRMSGAVLTMVRDGQVVLSKGYGFADLAAGTPVDPDQTQFRIGSNTKTFTAMAIARLMDEGRIDSLDDPANRYLQRLQLPAPHGTEITLKQLLTHSAGFENRVYNIGTDRTHDLPLSPEVIERYRPTLVSTPGRYSSYNNYGIAVLGLVIEDVTGQTIADYFEEQLFTPLGMSRSVLHMSPEPGEQLSTAYAFLPNGEAVAIPHRTVHPFYSPAGGINSTGTDMARYMQAQLDAGKRPNALLSAGMYEAMHTQLRANAPRSSGFGMTWFTMDWNGVRALVHGGDWPGTHSAMALFPDLNTGIFFALLADYPELPLLERLTGSERLTPDPDVTVDSPLSNLGVLFNFLENFFGAYERPEETGTAAADLAEYAGSYVGRSAPYSTMERLLSIVSPFSVIDVTVAEGGKGLLFNGNGQYAAKGADVFWKDAHSRMPLDGLFLDSPIFNFVRDDSGAIDYVVPQIGFDVWVRSGAAANPQNLGLAWVILFLVSLTSLIAIFYPRIPAYRWAKWLPGLLLCGLLLQPLILLLGYAPGTTLVDDLFFGRGGRFVLFAVASILVAMLALLHGYHVVLAWRERFWHASRFGAAMRLHYTLLGIGALLFIPVFALLNLFGL